MDVLTSRIGKRNQNASFVVRLLIKMLTVAKKLRKFALINESKQKKITIQKIKNDRLTTEKYAYCFDCLHFGDGWTSSSSWLEFKLASFPGSSLAPTKYRAWYRFARDTAARWRHGNNCIKPWRFTWLRDRECEVGWQLDDSSPVNCESESLLLNYATYKRNLRMSDRPVTRITIRGSNNRHLVYTLVYLQLIGLVTRPVTCNFSRICASDPGVYFAVCTGLFLDIRMGKI